MSGFHALFYFRFRQRQGAKTSRRSPRLGFPLWNPSSEAPPFSRNPQRGKPILPNTKGFLNVLGPFWGHRRAPRPPVRPLGLIFDLFSSSWPRSGRGEAVTRPPSPIHERQDVDWAFPSALKGLPEKRRWKWKAGRSKILPCPSARS